MDERKAKAEGRERRKHERIRVRLETKVVARSLGSAVSYDFVTHDVSGGGVFIRGANKEYPFKDQTLLEIWLMLRPEPQVAIDFLGKIAHTAGGGFGIRIVQIEEKDQATLDKFIKELVDSGAEVIPFKGG
jgi:hypothetical protein